MTDSAYKPHSLSSLHGERNLLALIPPCCLDPAKILHKQTRVTMQEVGVSHKQNTDICSLINKDLDGQLPQIWFSLITKQNTFSICNALPTPKRKIKPTCSLWFTEDKRGMQSFRYKRKIGRKWNIQVAWEKPPSCTEFLSRRWLLKCGCKGKWQWDISQLSDQKMLDPSHKKRLPSSGLTGVWNI